ncbi:MAG: FAD-dependent oxidoreductase [Candidatus Marinimicrobia bacterium]|nr:FAD-dependent oxidoreductase [Candidatus Neomarinimicrobiota bacterium]|tara:strand:- start:38161 stop:39414 length:1254 start_codon:yes stop_codon:yes gene_type:complete
MKIAIIGSGISGLTCAYLLAEHHNITLFEANSYLGGHSNTLDVTLGGTTYSVDTGFIVYNEKTYPHFNNILNELDVPTQASNMSFSVKCERTGLEYKPTSINTLFGQRRNLLDPQFFGMVRGILAFNKGARNLLEQDGDYQYTVKQFTKKNKINSLTFEKFIIPMASAIWSSPPEKISYLPMRYLARFYSNHGLLSINDHPQWRVIKGGSREYVNKMVFRFFDSIQMNSEVVEITRRNEGIKLKIESGETINFDAVILACHSDQCLKILTDPTPDEIEILSSIPYQKNTALLHTDSSVLPIRKSIWASWNSNIPIKKEDLVSLTYNMNILQSLDAPETICVSLNMEERINSEKVLERIVYHHPVYTKQTVEAQNRKDQISGLNNTYYAGAYWKYGFHEDGVVSALDVCKKLGVQFSV